MAVRKTLSVISPAVAPSPSERESRTHEDESARKIASETITNKNTNSVLASFEALTFDDVLLEPAYSEVLPKDVDLSTRFTRRVSLQIPLASAAMDTVTEGRLAIAMAQLGGIGVIHKSLSPEDQAREVHRVKRFQSAIVDDPITIEPDAKAHTAVGLMRDRRISGIPVVERGSRKLLGIITNRDVRFVEDLEQPVCSIMTQKKLVTVSADCSTEQARQLLHRHRLERLLVTDGEGCCIGLITVKDIEAVSMRPLASKDAADRLRVAAAVGASERDMERAQLLCDAGVDVLVVDTAHGHSAGVLEQVRRLRARFEGIDIVGGNIATAEGARALIAAGVDGVKVGIGPGSICTTRIVAGVGVPQLSAIWDVACVCGDAGVAVIADGGVRYGGDLAKAIGAGADCVMVGSLLAGTDESPGEVFFAKGRAYKRYRGMGSEGAMARGSADRYFQEEVMQSQKFVAEGIEGRVPYRGALEYAIDQLGGGLRAAMGYTGNRTIGEMRGGCSFRRITGAGREESYPHDVVPMTEGGRGKG